MKLLKPLFLLLLVALLLLSSIIGYVVFFPLKSSGDTVEFRIKRGEGLKTISNELEDKGLIKSSNIFYYFVMVNKKAPTIKAGLYKINKNINMPNLVTLLNNPIPEGVLVNIPEGLNIEQTYSKINSQFPIDSVTFVTFCNNKENAHKLGLEGVVSLEGYLFPETYKFPKEYKEIDIIKMMVSTFKERYNAIDKSGKYANWSMNKIVTLASVIEKETQAPKERKRISAVFHNRLDRGIPLGADATVRYAVKRFTGPLHMSELNTNSPYNTRRFKGLPPGPICSPGSKSIDAALHPIESKELFFVAKWDGSGEHYFSETNAEHNRKKMQVRKAHKKLQNW